MISARYRYVVVADSPRDGGWVRVFWHYKNIESAEEAIVRFMPLMVRSGDYRRLRIVKRLFFHT